VADQSIEPHDPALAPLTIDREPLKGQKALVTGIANQGSIACGAARALKAFGTNLAMTYLNDKTCQFTQPLADVLEVDPRPLFAPRPGPTCNPIDETFPGRSLWLLNPYPHWAR